MRIIIPTYKRTDRQVTFESLPENWLTKVRFVANREDAPKLRRKYCDDTGAKVVIHPPEITTIAAKRAWILQQEKWDKIIMLDDDLRPYARIEDTAKLRKADHADLDWGFRKIRKKLDTLVHCGISPRLGNHLVSDGGWVDNTRMIYALAYRASVVREVCILGRVEVREDMELSVQLLKKGYPNAVLYDLAFEQATGYDSKGGMAAQGRSVERSNAEALKFMKLHPGIVNVVKRDYKSSTKRWEVVVQWQKAIEMGTKPKRGFFK